MSHPFGATWVGAQISPAASFDSSPLEKKTKARDVFRTGGRAADRDLSPPRNFFFGGAQDVFVCSAAKAQRGGGEWPRFNSEKRKTPHCSSPNVRDNGRKMGVGPNCKVA